jgi:hypothetical protein
VAEVPVPCLLAEGAENETPCGIKGAYPPCCKKATRSDKPFFIRDSRIILKEIYYG